MSMKILNQIDKDISGLFKSGSSRKGRSTGRKWAIKTRTGKVVSKHSSKSAAITKAAKLRAPVRVAPAKGKGQSVVINGKMSTARKRRSYAAPRRRKTTRRKTRRNSRRW